MPARPLSLLYLDLDGFKAGSTIALATRPATSCCRASPKGCKPPVGPDDFVARLGGDEFVVLRRGPATREQLGELAVSIHDRLTAAYELGAIVASVGLSIGIAVRREPMTISQFVASADAALYRAKAAEGLTIAFDELAEGVPQAA